MGRVYTEEAFAEETTWFVFPYSTAMVGRRVGKHRFYLRRIKVGDEGISEFLQVRFS